MAVQPSLLHGVDLNKPVPRRYDLRMDDFVGSEAFEKRKPLFLERTRRTAKAAITLPLPSARLKLPPTLPSMGPSLA